VRYKPLYEAIGETDNRHRKPMAIGRMVERLMLLDAVLADPTFTWLASEADKRRYFMLTLSESVPLDQFPRLTFGQAPTSTVRHFPDKMPIGIERHGYEHVFVYLVRQPDPMDFRVFLVRHGELLRNLYRWTVRVLFPQPFARAIPRFAHAAREQLTGPMNPAARPEMAWYFRQRQATGERSPADDERFRNAIGIYRAPRFRALHRVWLEHGDWVLSATPSQILQDKLDRREARFEFMPLRRQYLHLSSLVGIA
jgi:hypothetical protein